MITNSTTADEPSAVCISDQRTWTGGTSSLRTSSHVHLRRGDHKSTVHSVEGASKAQEDVVSLQFLRLSINGSSKKVQMKRIHVKCIEHGEYETDTTA